MLYLQMLTRADIRQQYPTFKVVKYDKVTQKFLPLSIAPDIGIYQVVKGIEELELIG